MKPHLARLCVLMSLALLALPALARAADPVDPVTQWDAIASRVLTGSSTATPPLGGQGAAAVPHLAMVHAAIFDAVNSIDPRYEPYLGRCEPSARSPRTSRSPRPPTACSSTAGSSAPRPSTTRWWRSWTRRTRPPRRPSRMGGGQGGRDRDRRGRRVGGDRGAHRRRPVCRGPVPRRSAGSGRLAADAAGLHQRPGRMAEERHPVRLPTI